MVQPLNLMDLDLIGQKFFEDLGVHLGLIELTADTPEDQEKLSKFIMKIDKPGIGGSWLPDGSMVSLKVVQVIVDLTPIQDED